MQEGDTTTNNGHMSEGSNESWFTDHDPSAKIKGGRRLVNLSKVAPELAIGGGKQTPNILEEQDLHESCNFRAAHAVFSRLHMQCFKDAHVLC